MATIPCARGASHAIAAGGPMGGNRLWRLEREFGPPSPSKRQNPKALIRARVQVVPNAQAPTLPRFFLNSVERGSGILTDGLK